VPTGGRVVSVVDAITPARRADSDRGRAQQPGDQGDRRRRAQLEKAADAEKEGQPGGWRRYGGPRAEHGNPATMWDRRRQRDWKGPRMRRRIWHGGHGRMARRQGPASTGSAMGYGVDRDGAFQADPKWAGPITGPGPGRRPDAVSWPRMRTRWYRRGGGSPNGRGRSPPVSRHGNPGVDKTGCIVGRSGRAWAHGRRAGYKSKVARRAVPGNLKPNDQGDGWAGQPAGGSGPTSGARLTRMRTGGRTGAGRQAGTRS